jgi:chromosome segregation ATPase
VCTCFFVPSIYSAAMARKPDPAQVPLPFDVADGDEALPVVVEPEVAPASAGVVAEKAEERRGRPRKWESDAERKRAYRERLAADFAEPDRLRRELRNERRRVASRDRQLARLRRDLERTEAEIATLGREKEDLVENQAGLEQRLEFFEAKAARAEKRLSDELRKDPKHPFHGRS